MKATAPSLDIYENGIRIRELDVPRQSVAEFLRGSQEDARLDRLVEVIEVGTFCLERASAARDIDFVRHQIDVLIRSVEAAVRALPVELESAVVAKIGSDDGQVLAPVRGLVDRASETVNGRLRDLRELVERDLDPGRATSTLGKALKELRELLDPKRNDSVHAALSQAVRDVSASDGLLSKSVKRTVDEALKPLADQVDRLSRQVAGAEAAATVVDSTPLKGKPYEAEIVEELRRWCGRHETEVHHVGVDNRPGDVLLIHRYPVGDPLRLIVEVRDRSSASRLGRKAITDTVEKAMAEREASAAIFLSHSVDGLAAEVGDWAEGECHRGPFLAVTHQDLFVAVRWLVLNHVMRQERISLPEVDEELIRAQVARARTALARIGTINRSVTQIRTGAASVENEAESLRSEIRRALTAIEDALQPGDDAQLAPAREVA